MSSKKRILFIVNPISGIGKQKRFEKILKNNIDYKIYEPVIWYTEYAGHTVVLAKKAIEENFDIIAAVGGDGTVNEVAEQLINQNVTLAIIPLGSGNGLARYLKIPLFADKAIQYLNHAQSTNIDTCSIDGKFFISIAGVGFDSLVAARFEQEPGRGFKTYFKVITEEYFKYQMQNYTIIADGVSYQREALFVALSNSDQFGYNIRIAPNADIKDGKMDICIVKKPPLALVPMVVAQVLAGMANKCKYVEIIHAKDVKIIGNTNQSINLDGEAVLANNILNANVNPSSLKVMLRNSNKMELLMDFIKDFQDDITSSFKKTFN